MNELITVNFETQTISARELHNALEIERRFSAWFETNSQGFIENQDFSRVYLKVQANRYGGEQDLQDYALSVDMAKHICLMSRTEKGKQCRQYLIELEKAWNTPEQVMARALQIANSTIDSLKDRCKFLGTEIAEKSKLIEELTPKATYYDLILQCAGLLSTTEISKDYGMSATTFNKLLHKLKIQFKQCERWFLYSKYDGMGYTQSKTHNIPRPDGTQKACTHMYWTQKGRLFLYEELKKNGIYPCIEQMQ